MYWRLGLPVPDGSSAAAATDGRGRRGGLGWFPGRPPLRVPLPLARAARLDPLGSGTTPPGGPEIGAVEEGVAPEFAWIRPGLQTTSCGVTGDADARLDHVFSREHCPAPAAVGEPVFFAEMHAREFVGEVIPGWRTVMLGYADALAGGPATSPGPLFNVDLGQHLVVRVRNAIDPELHLNVSVHLHGGHTPAHSDGHPNFLIEPGAARDYYYPNGIPRRIQFEPASGTFVPTPDWDETEVPSTMWYHDHAIDITAHNALMGLAGMYLLHDDRERELQSSGVLPPPSRDLPLALRDVCLTPIRERGEMHPAVQQSGGEQAEARIHFDPFDHDGSLGDFVLVNGVFAPTVKLTPEKWRLRILNASLARMYNLALVVVDAATPVHERITHWKEGRSGSEATNPLTLDDILEVLPFQRIGKDSWMMDEPLNQRFAFLSMANRADIVVDLESLKGRAGDVCVYLVSTLRQEGGRGPNGGEELAAVGQGIPDHAAPDRWLWLTRIEVSDQVAAPTATVAPARICPPIATAPTLRPHHKIVDLLADIPQPDPEHSVFTELDVGPVPTRRFDFERSQGAWKINAQFYDGALANAVPALFGVERWILRNRSGGWWHPIHIHLESHQLVFAESGPLLPGGMFIADPRYLDLLSTSERRRLTSGRTRLEWPETDELAVHPAVLFADPIGEEDRELRRVAQRIDRTLWHTGIKHDTAVLAGGTEVHILMQFRTFRGPFVFHCHNLNHEDMMMMFQFDPRPDGPKSDQPVARDYFFYCNRDEVDCVYDPMGTSCGGTHP